MMRLEQRSARPSSTAFLHRAIVALACLIFLGGCADHISRADLLVRIESNSPPRIVDVRSTSEYEEARVPGAVHVSFYSLLFNLEQLPESEREDEPFVVYCEHGPRAGIARAQLWLAGAGPVLFMEGHMIAWKEDGLPVESGLAASSERLEQTSTQPSTLPSTPPPTQTSNTRTPRTL